MSRFLLALALTGSLSLFMTSWLSLPLWDVFGFLQKIQFPWRWLSVASLVGSVVLAAAVFEILKQRPQWSRPVAYFVLSTLLLVVVFNTSQQIIPSAPLTRDALDSRLASVDSREGCTCWWPTWATRTALENPTKVSAADRGVEISQWEAEERSFSVGAGAAATARIATFYYPRWKATVNGIEVPVEKDENGAIVVKLPAEDANVRLYFEEPLLLQSTRWISAVAWIGLLAGLGAALFPSKRPTNISLLTELKTFSSND